MRERWTMRQRAIAVLFALGALLGLGAGLRSLHGRDHHGPWGGRFGSPAASYPPPAYYGPPAQYAQPPYYAPPPPPSYPPWGPGYFGPCR